LAGFDGKIASKAPCLALSDGADWRNPMGEKIGQDASSRVKMGNPIIIETVYTMGRSAS
jgi:hypothetical protein